MEGATSLRYVTAPASTRSETFRALASGDRPPTFAGRLTWTLEPPRSASKRTVREREIVSASAETTAVRRWPGRGRR